MTCSKFREHPLFCSSLVCCSSFNYNIYRRSPYFTAHLERGQRGPHAPSEDASSHPSNGRYLGKPPKQQLR